jgi:hypothetical protein
MDFNLTTGGGIAKALSIAVGVVAAGSGAATFLVGLATTSDVEKAVSRAAPSSIVVEVARNTQVNDDQTAAIAKIDKDAAVRDAVVNGKLNVLLSAQAEQVRRNPQRRKQMARSIEQVREKADAAGVQEDPFAGIEAIQEVADAEPAEINR